MRRILAVFISFLIFFALSGCGSKTSNDAKAKDDLYVKAIEILNELSEDERVSDFLYAYDLLMSLPNNEDKFISQLKKANDIYEKYGVELKSGDYYLMPKHAIGIDKEGMDDYRSGGAYSDADTLMKAIVYPALFEKYGEEAQSVQGVTAQGILSAIKSTGDYIFDEKTEQYDGSTEEWKSVGTPETTYEIKYHSNGLVERITVPIIRSNDPLSDEEWVALLDKDGETQKQIEGSRFTAMRNQFHTISDGYEVLSQIFTDKEITIISNYIHSLTLEEIWDRNLYALASEPTDYIGAIVMFDYQGNSVGIHFNLNDIALDITGTNYVTPLSCRWYTLYCGLCLREGEQKEKNIELYKDYINNNTAYNTTVQDYSFDLDKNAELFTEAPSINTDQTQEDEKIEAAVTENSTCDTQYYSVTLPDSWKNKTVYEITNGEKGGYSLSFYHTATRDANGGGRLFTIELLSENEDYSKYPECRYLGELSCRTGSYHVLALMPSDVQWIEEYREEYQKMSSDIPDVLHSISFKGEYTFIVEE